MKLLGIRRNLFSLQLFQGWTHVDKNDPDPVCGKKDHLVKLNYLYLPKYVMINI